MQTEFVRDQIKALNDQLSALEKTAFLVGPTVVQAIPPMHKIVLSTVRIDPLAQGTCYVPEGAGVDGVADDAKKLALGYLSLLQIAQAAGVEWVTNQCGRIDDRTDSHVMVYRATCRWRDTSGMEREISAEYVKDLSVAYDMFCAKGKDEDKARLETLRLHQSLLQRVESGAKARAIRQALALRTSGYSKAELRSKPFIVPRLIPDIDWENDPFARQMLTAKAMGVLPMFFGSRGGYGEQPAPALPGADGRAMPAIAPAAAPPLALPGPTTEPVTVPATLPVDDDMPPETDDPFDSDEEEYDAEASAGPNARPPTLEEFQGWVENPEHREACNGWVVYLLETRVFEGDVAAQIAKVQRQKASNLSKWYANLLPLPLKG